MTQTPDSNAPELDAETLKKRARLGAVLMLMRTVVLQVAVLIANLFLARWLEPGEFGIFAVVQFILSLVNVFGDAGLGAALIQSKDEPSQRLLSSVFNAQLIIAAAVVALVWMLAGPITSFWEDLPASGEWLLRAVALALLLTTLRVLPTILMERQLLFGRLAALDIVTTLSFYASALVLAAMGHGVWALVASVLVQGFTGVLLAYALRPWRPTLELDRVALKPIIAFGLPYQAKHAVGFANGAVAPIFAASVLGVESLGFINWAQGLAYTPLKLVEIMARVTFPLYSRLQSKPKMLAETLGRSLHLCAVGTMFFVALYLGLGEPIIRILYTDKWMPALPLLRIYAGVISIGFLAPIFAAALDASGKPKVFFKLSLIWTGINWAVVPVTTHYWGMLGFTAGYAVHVVVGNLLAVVITHRVFPGMRLPKRLYGAIAAAGAMLAFEQLVAPWCSDGLGFAAAVACSFIVFVVTLLLVDRKGLIDAFAIVPKNQPDEQSDKNEA